ncbi:hypothetical protein P8452_23140 [Trifolium repens]|nr:hypothetical protein P8452_23140 [Trifolium repens]
MNVRTISIINWFKGGSQFHVSQVGKATKSMLQKTPIVTGNASKGNRLQQRKSLADAGTSWESGVRRSTRFRTKPLECWKGERTVYGRVHESLSTVIGVKCMSGK